MAVNRATVQSDQNLIDLAIQETGSVEGLIALLRNNNLTAHDTLAAGTVIKTNPSDILNATAQGYFSGNGVVVNTGYWSPDGDDDGGGDDDRVHSIEFDEVFG